MKKKPVSPNAHALIDYALVFSLLTVPLLFRFNKKVKKIYTAEALILLGYIALTDTPVALKPLIPFPVHGKIDPFNVSQFALQSFMKSFRKDKKTLLFNIGFTIIAGTVVALTDWHGKTMRTTGNNQKIYNGESM